MGTYLTISGQIRSDSVHSLAGLGVLVEGMRDTTVVFRRLTTQFGGAVQDPKFSQVYTWVDQDTVSRARPAPFRVDDDTLGLRPNPTWGCPSRASLVEVARLGDRLGIVTAVAHDTARRLAALRSREHGHPNPVVVIADTALLLERGELFHIGVVANSTGHVVRGVRVGFLRAQRKDSSWIDVGDLAPHALAAFSAGNMSYNEVATYTVRAGSRRQSR